MGGTSIFAAVPCWNHQKRLKSIGKRSTRGRVKMGLACPEVCAEPHVEDEEKFPGSCSLGLRGAPCKEWETFHGSQFSRSARSSCKAGGKLPEVRGILAGAERV